MSEVQNNAAVLSELGQVKGQLTVLLQVIQSNNSATNQRIDDLRDSVVDRLDSHEKRISTLEANERGTAVKAGAGAVIGGAIVSAAIKAMSGLG